MATARVVSSNYGVESWSHGTALHARIQPESLATPDFMSHTVAGHKTSSNGAIDQGRSGEGITARESNAKSFLGFFNKNKELSQIL